MCPVQWVKGSCIAAAAKWVAAAAGIQFVAEELLYAPCPPIKKKKKEFLSHCYSGLSQLMDSEFPEDRSYVTHFCIFDAEQSKGLELIVGARRWLHSSQ